MVKKAEDIIYYEETAGDGNTSYRFDYRGIAIRKPKSMFDGQTDLQIKQEFFRHIKQENIYDIFSVDTNAKKVTTEEI
jgi:hypothetical protein|tara:strand:+ start:804 stop:1037 length:234 start_codon:yes stop_codon:yes gene_type:complete